jgi:hypothetical protein
LGWGLGVGGWGVGVGGAGGGASTNDPPLIQGLEQDIIVKLYEKIKAQTGQHFCHTIFEILSRHTCFLHAYSYFAQIHHQLCIHICFKF